MTENCPCRFCNAVQCRLHGVDSCQDYQEFVRRLKQAGVDEAKEKQNRLAGEGAEHERYAPHDPPY